MRVEETWGPGSGPRPARKAVESEDRGEDGAAGSEDPVGAGAVPPASLVAFTRAPRFPPNFFSDRISNAQRLANGNTLINEGNFGRFFDVTRAGEVIWEYLNPYFGPQSVSATAQQNSVFRVYRYTEEEVATARMA